MSASQILGAVVGVVVGVYTGNPQAGFLAYSAIAGVGGYLSQPDQMGPRLEDLRTQMSTYGAPIPFEWGANRHAGTIMWPRILDAVEHEQSESTKGGPDAVTYTYTLSCAVLVCEGPIAGIRRIWANKKLVYDMSNSSVLDEETEDVGGGMLSGGFRSIYDPVIGQIRFYLGTEDQVADPLIEAADGASPAYRGYAYVVFEDYDVTELNGRPPQWEFEVIADGATEIETSSTFGEEYIPGGGGAATFEADMDSDGHLWLHTMDGHAVVVDEVTGELALDFGVSGVPQIQEYNAATGELLWFFNVPGVNEAEPSDPEIVYSIRGTGLYSGGYYFIGRGSPGKEVLPNDQYGCAVTNEYAHGLAVNIATRQVTRLIDGASSGQFQNTTFWPSVPIPVIDNNKVFFAGGNGISGGFSAGFMPASIAIPGQPDYDPVPDRSGSEHKWVTVDGAWTQTNPKENICGFGGGKPPGLTSTNIALPNWAYRSTVVQNPNVVVVQGYGAGGGSYLAVIASDPPVDSYTLTGPSVVTHCELPGSATTMPPFVWDEANGVIWAFAGADANNLLYSIAFEGGVLTPTLTEFIMPDIGGGFQTDHVMGMTIDPNTGSLLLIRGSGSNGYITLFDPTSETIISNTAIADGIAPTTGKMWVVPSQNRVIFANGFSLHSIPYGLNIEPEVVQLSQIVSDICLRSGLTADDIDVTELTDMVDGYIVPRQMTARAALEPLQAGFFFDAVEHDDKIKFVKRDSVTVTTIPEDERAAHENGQSMPDALTVTRAFELEVPFQCEVEYPDVDADHLIGTQYDRRLTKSSRERMTVALPIVMSAEKAKQIARTMLYEAWQVQSFRWCTSLKYAHLKPTDKVALPTQAATYQARITTKREQPNGVIEWEGVVTAFEVYDQTGEGAAPTDYVSQTIYTPGETILALLDIPMLRDDDDDAGFYVAMAGTRPSWRGAQLFRSSDDGANYEALFGTTNEAAIGIAQSILADFTAGNIFDEGGSVQVYMTSGLTLTSVTQDQVLNGSNKAVIGARGRWEVVHFKNAELVAPDTYLLSGLLRGCRGTEWATGLHQLGDTFVLASTVSWNRLIASDTGLPRLYKAPPMRVRLDDVSSTNFTNVSIALKPFSPVDLLGVRNGSNDLALTWNRRTRLAAGTLHLPVLLGEATESYSIDIVVADAVVRTITSTTPTATYLATEQTEDGITPGDPVTARVYQISAAVGRGYQLEATL